MNTRRILVGGLIAGLLCFLGDGLVHGVLLQSRWQDIAAALHLTSTDAERRASLPLFLAYDIVKGTGAVLLYALIRPRFGPGPRTALNAGLITWALCIPLPLTALLPMRFFGLKFVVLWSIYGAFPVLIGAIAGAAFYRERQDAAGSFAQSGS